jgi:aminopeptidase N
MKNLHRVLFLSVLFISTLAVYPQDRVRTYDIQHYILRTSFNRATKTVLGDTTIQLKPLGEGFKTLELDAVGLKYTSIKLEPSGKNLTYRQNGEKLIIELDKPYSPNDLISVRVKYSTLKPKKGVYFVDAQVERGKVIRSAQIWTQGEAEEAHHWFPSYDFPDDKATTEQYLTVSAGETAIANGELVETLKNPNGSRTFHYKMPVPHSIYLTSFIVGKYSRIPDKYKNIPLSYYVYPGREATGRKAFGKTPEMIKIFEQLTGFDFPYNKYDQTIVAQFNFGGMENITATTMADTEIFAADFMPNEIQDLVSHELAHSWFGNLVTTKNWSNLWLNEGFATFMEAAYREKAFGRADYMRKVREDAQAAMLEDTVNPNRHPLLRPNAPTDDSLFDTTTYKKGGAVIHTLREEIGTENFWKGVNIYLNRHKFQNVVTDDFKKAMEEASGKNLDWFFNQWVKQSGFPRLNVTQSFDVATNKLTLNVSQIQETTGNAPSAFILPMEVEIQTAAGAKTEKLDIRERNQTFTIQLDGNPTRIIFDKNQKIPLKLVKIS